MAASKAFLPWIYSSIISNDPNLPGVAMPNDGWYMAGANPQRTSWTKDEIRGKLKPVWYYRAEDYISQKVQVIVTNNSVYLSTSGGLVALDARSGKPRWKYNTDLPLGHSPTVVDEIVYVGGYDHKLHALKAGTGEFLWAFEAQAGFETNPLVAEGKVIAGSRDGYLYGIYTTGAQVGQLAWKFETGGPILYSPAYRDGVIYFASNDNYAYAVRASDGALVWRSGKLPGHGFHSWWPVIYGDYVIFSGSYNYRYVDPFPAPHTDVESDEIYPDNSERDNPIGQIGTTPGNWMEGTTTINNTTATEYFERFPHRRTYIVLQRQDGKEYTFDSNLDSRPEYAPILWTGTHSGTRFPPAVGPDNVLYQSNNLTYAPHIARGKISGWQFGTPFVSLTTGPGTAIDEPVSYAIGGNVIYWKRCCDRMAGSFEVNRAQGTADELESWNYFDEGGSMIRRWLPELFDAGWDWAYWKHGDQSPPIPYRGQVYMIINNAVVAFSPTGKDPVLSSNPESGSMTGEDPKDIEKEILVQGLNANVTLDGTSWPSILQQETYYSTEDDYSARGQWFQVLNVVAGGESLAGVEVNAQDNITQINSLLTSGQRFRTWVPKRSPSVLFDNPVSSYQLQGNFSAFAYPSKTGVQVTGNISSISGDALTEGWLLAWEAPPSNNDEQAGVRPGSRHRWSPVVIGLQRRPSQFGLSDGSLNLQYSGAAGYLTATPLYGMSRPISDEANTWLDGIPAETVERVRQLERLSRAIPESYASAWSIDSTSGDAVLSLSYRYIEVTNEWGAAPQKIAYLPPRLALAAWDSSPITINGLPLSRQLDLDYLTPLGRFAGVPNGATAIVRLPGLAAYWRSPSSPGSPTGVPTALKDRLKTEVQKIVEAGHLLPGYGIVGMWETRSNDRIGDDLVDYWKNPADTVYTLLQALPLLPADLQSRVRSYVQAEFDKYPLYKTAHSGWNSGANRNAFDLPPEVVAAGAEIGPESETPFNNWKLPPQNFYALWMYAREVGGAPELFEKSRSKLDLTPTFRTSLPYSLNSTLAGYIGYLRLASMSGISDPTAEEMMIELWIMRAALSKYPAALSETGFEYGGDDWTLRSFTPSSSDTLFSARVVGSLWSQMELYGFPLDSTYNRSGASTGGDYTFAIDYVNLTPEVAAFLKKYARAETAASVASYTRRAPYWFVAEAEEAAGEGVFHPLYDRWAYFQAKAQILDVARSELEWYLDVPATPLGDLYYIQNLTAIIRARP